MRPQTQTVLEDLQLDSSKQVYHSDSHNLRTADTTAMCTTNARHHQISQCRDLIGCLNKKYLKYRTCFPFNKRLAKYNYNAEGERNTFAADNLCSPLPHIILAPSVQIPFFESCSEWGRRARVVGSRSRAFKLYRCERPHSPLNTAVNGQILLAKKKKSKLCCTWDWKNFASYQAEPFPYYKRGRAGQRCRLFTTDTYILFNAAAADG